MYTTVYAQYDTPEHLKHGLDALPAEALERAVLMVSRRQAERLDGKPVAPDPVAVEEGEEAPAPAEPAPAFDALNVKLWKKQRTDLPTMAVGDVPPEEADLRDIANSYRPYLDQGKILVVLRGRHK